MATTKRHDVKDLALAPEGVRRIEWADRQMPVLQAIRERFEREQPLAGYRISACLHVTTETANLMRTLKAGGADVVLCASNPLSTQDDVAAALVEEYDISVFAIKGEDNDTYYSHIEAAVDHKPQLTMDDGADVISVLHSARREQLGDIIAGMEETTTGVIRLKAMEADGALEFPVIAVNEARTKHFFDNRYGTGQSTIDGIIRATNVLIAGGKFVVAGLRLGRPRRRDAREGPRRARDRHRGRSDARARGADGRLRGAADGRGGQDRQHLLHRDRRQARDRARAHRGDEGRRDHLQHGPLQRRDRHPGAARRSPSRRARRATSSRSSQLADGRRHLPARRGRLVNISAAEGHPALVMDMSFANQALATEYAVQNAASLENKVYPVPTEIDEEIARLKLATMGVEIDQLTAEQSKYLASWDEGT